MYYKASQCSFHTRSLLITCNCLVLFSPTCLCQQQGLSDWRTKLDSQVRNCQEDMGALNKNLKTEVGQLRTEFNDLRSTLRQQMELTVSLAKGETQSEAGATPPQKLTV